MKIAEYDRQLYQWVRTGSGMHLVTHDGKKAEGFFLSDGIYRKKIRPGDRRLAVVQDVHFVVEYYDDVECATDWVVDEGIPLCRVPSLENGELGISVAHESRGGEWVTHKKGAACRIIKMTDCKSFIVHVQNIIENGIELPVPWIQTLPVSMEEFRQIMIQHRPENI